MVHSTVCGQPFSACGGDLRGTWRIVGVCLESDLTKLYNQDRADAWNACADSCVSATVAASGTVTYTDQVATYDVTTVEITSDSYSPACASQRYAISSLDQKMCDRISAVETLLYPGGSLEENCKYVGSDCRCESRVPTTNRDSPGYTMSTVSSSTV